MRLNNIAMMIGLVGVLGLGFASTSQAVIIDPGTFPDNTDLTNAYAGVTLLADVPATAPGDFVTNSSPPGEPTQFIMRFGVGGSLDGTWTDDPGFVRIFQADFAADTNFVSVDIRDGGSDPFGSSSIGVLEAFSSGDLLLESSTALLTSDFTYQELFITRASADIAYVRVYGTGPTGPSSDHGANISLLTFNAAAVPEPASIAIWTLLGLALSAVGYYRARRNK